MSSLSYLLQPEARFEVDVTPCPRQAQVNCDAVFRLNPEATVWEEAMAQGLKFGKIAPGVLGQLESVDNNRQL